MELILSVEFIPIAILGQAKLTHGFHSSPTHMFMCDRGRGEFQTV